MSAQQNDLRQRVRDLTTDLAALQPVEIVESVVGALFKGRIALVSSFGAEAAVLLHMVAMVAPSTPVLFVDTGKLFGETLRYRDRLVGTLGLSDVRTLRAPPSDLALVDPDGMLWQSDPDACCALRKVVPLAPALASFDAWLNGRKRHHGGVRAGLPLVEADGPRLKLNPLAAWQADDIDAYFEKHGLPRHPLVEDGFASIGCMPCTARVAPDEDVRAGRWRGLGRTECGIHQTAELRPE